MNSFDSVRDKLRINIQPKHFSQEEIDKMNALLSSKITDFLEVCQETEDISLIDQKLNEISEVIMDSVRYPAELFHSPQLFLSCAMLLQSDNIKYLKDVIRFLSMILYSSKGLSSCLKDFFPNLFALNEVIDSQIFYRRFFSFLTNFLHDLQSIDDVEYINEFINEYLLKILDIISSHKTFFEEELRFLFVVSSSFTYEKYSDFYESFLDYLFAISSECIQRPDSLNTVLWSIFSNYQYSEDAFAQYVISKDLIRLFFDTFLTLDENFINCVEPCFSIIFGLVQTLQDFSFIQVDDLPLLLHFSIVESRYIRLLALKLIRIISPHFSNELIQLHIENLMINEDDEYELVEQIVFICINLLTSTHPQFFVENKNFFELLLSFLLSKIEYSNEVIENGVKSLVTIKEQFSIIGQLPFFNEIFDKSGGTAFLDSIEQAKFDLISDFVCELESS